MPKCSLCADTGWYGDNGAGIKGNREYVPCDLCKSTKDVFITISQAELEAAYAKIERLRKCKKCLDYLMSQHKTLWLPCDGCVFEDKKQSASEVSDAD